MVAVEFWRPGADARSDPTMVAELTVDARHVELTGPEQHVIDFTLPVLSASTGRVIRYDEDPEEWARSLVGSYRSPYLLAQITHDDNPPDNDTADREDVRIRQRAH